MATFSLAVNCPCAEPEEIFTDHPVTDYLDATLHLFSTLPLIGISDDVVLETFRKWLDAPDRTMITEMVDNGHAQVVVSFLTN